MLDSMPPTPSTRRQRVGIELRKLRDAAGKTTSEAAAVLGLDRTKITLIEQGLYAVSPERVVSLACEYEEGDAEFVEVLARMAGDRSKGWWEEYRGFVPTGFLDISELEHHAHGLLTYQICHLPGAMQTEEYSRAIFREAHPPLTPRLLETRVEYRVRRSQLLMAEGAPEHTAIVHEAALRMRFGGNDVARAQLDQLLELSHLPHVTLRAVGFDAEGFKGAGQTVTYAKGAVPRLDTVLLDAVGTPVFLHDRNQVENYRKIIEMMAERSVSVEKTRDLIAQIRKDL
ncbi:helix-turn-helix domain-containing protein [Kitasatospora purpeofusca]|uniref:helix-turn-helix domain-containing protein n=1 Tax=Kitasatospora purpeofusca TaxID=67352 RepID=UPI00365F6C8F